MENLNTTQLVIEQCNHIPQLLSIKDVMKYTSIGRSTIYAMGQADSDYYDPTFPKKLNITKVRTVWVATEIAEWINSKIEARSA